jgi:inner membrane protein
LACVVPDVDGLGIVPELLTRNSAHPLLWFSLYHHRLHTLSFAIVVALISGLLGSEKWKTGLLALVSFHIHLAEDTLGSRGPEGYQWPIPYLSPFSSSLQLMWRGQWTLNSWQNYVITLAFLLVTFWLAWYRGFSPLEMFSEKADAAFVAALRQRLESPIS